MKRIVLFTAAVLLSLPALAAARFDLGSESTRRPLFQSRNVKDLGRGVGIVFSPDLSVSTNQRVYETFGFAFFEDPSWSEVIHQIEAHNADPLLRPIHMLLIESHGANGNGLKLQRSKDPTALRSYISLGALQERLESSGVKLVILSACNAGRLFRPEIYSLLDPDNGDELFLPPTLGIINATSAFRPERSPVRIVRRAESRLETLVHGKAVELSEAVREQTSLTNEEFVVSTLLIQLVTGDRSLRLTSDGYVAQVSKSDFTPNESEVLFQRLVKFFDQGRRWTGTR